MAYVTHSPHGIWCTNIRGYGIDVTMVYVTLCVTFPIITPPWPETIEKRLDLTSYISYNDAENRRPWWPTAFSIILAHIAR